MKAFLRRPQTALLRRALFQVHLWIGILAGLYIFVVCVTGSALVFRINLQRMLHPDLFTPSADGPLADPVTVMEQVQARYPDGRLSGIDAPTTARPTYLAYVTRGAAFRTVLIDPVTAQVLGELPDRSLVRTMQDLHFDLLAGKAGRIVNGAGGLLLLIMAVTGLVIWWPGIGAWRRALTIDFRRSWARVNWDLHSAVGVWTVVFISGWALTGAYFAFPSQFRAAVNGISPLTVSRAPVSGPPASGAAPPTWRTLVAEARRHAPAGIVARVVVPASGKAAFLVLFAEVAPTPVRGDLTPVYLDQYTGAVVQAPARGPRTAGDVVMAWVAPLHVGSFGGAGVKVTWFVLGLAPPLLFVTGFVMWWVRVVRPRRSRVLAAPALET